MIAEQNAMIEEVMSKAATASVGMAEAASMQRRKSLRRS